MPGRTDLKQATVTGSLGGAMTMPAPTVDTVICAYHGIDGRTVRR